MNLAFGGHLRDRNKIKAKSVLEPSAHPAGVYLGFRSMKRQEVLQLPPGWDACSSQGYPSPPAFYQAFMTVPMTVPI